MSANVGIVIVSHSADVARGTASMVEQMVGREVPLGWCGGDPDGGLGTNVEAILKAIEAAWSESGVGRYPRCGAPHRRRIDATLMWGCDD